MEIKKNTLVWVIDRKMIPHDRLPICLVTGRCSDGYYKMRDWRGVEMELPEEKLGALAQSRVKTRSVRKALASCYEKVIARLIGTNDFLNEKTDELQEKVAELQRLVK